MIHYIQSVCRDWLVSLNFMMFSIGYMVTALVAGSYYYLRGILASLSLKDKESYNEHADGLLDKGDASFELFLNQLCLVAPDKWRKHITYRLECW